MSPPFLAALSGQAHHRPEATALAWAGGALDYQSPG